MGSTAGEKGLRAAAHRALAWLVLSAENREDFPRRHPAEALNQDHEYDVGGVPRCWIEVRLGRLLQGGKA